MTRCVLTGIAVVLGLSLISLPALAQSAPTTYSQPATPIANGNSGAEACSHSPICAWGKGRDAVVHEQRTPNLGYSFAYPFKLPEGLTGGISAVALNSK